MQYVLFIPLGGADLSMKEPCFQKLMYEGFKEKRVGKSIIFFRRLHSLDSDFILSNEKRLLIGSPIERETGSYVKEINILSLDKIEGRYIYIDTQREQVEIYRDPIGQIGCYYFFYNKCYLIVTSDIEIITLFTNLTLSVNRNFFITYLLRGFQYTGKTPFLEFKELSPGQKLSHKNSKIEINPWFKLSYQQNYDEELIINNIKKSVDIYIRQILDKNILIHYSGGIDSTFLLYFLKLRSSFPENIQAFNIYHPKIPSSDETKIAQEICDKLGIKLTRFNLENALPFSPVLNYTTLPNKPACGMVQAKLWQKLHAFADNQNALQVSGHGGDHVFSVVPIEEAFIDILFKRGPLQAVKYLKEICHFYRKPYFLVLSNLIKTLLNSNQYIRTHNNLLNNEISKEKELNNFSYSNYSMFRPGKLKHERDIMIGISDISVDPSGAKLPIHYPLLSLNVIETALSIPPELLFQNQYGRYIYRKAISDISQSSSAWRKDKGEISGVLQLGFNKNYKHVLEMIMDGYLIREKIVNKELLEKKMQLFKNGIDSFNSREITYIYSAEFFLSLWSGK